MKHCAFFLASILAGALFLSACATPRTVAFNEADFVRYGGSGSGAVTGKAFVVFKDGSVRVANQEVTVKLMPATAYTEEVDRVVFAGGNHLQPPDPRFAKYVRKVHPAGDGHFVFTHLPPGEYYVAAHLHWTYPDTEALPEGGVTNIEANADQWISDRCSVKNGEVTTVVSWAQWK
jgi:hypothetical protein